MVSLTQTPEEVLYDNVSNGELPRGPLQTLLDEMVAGINANEGGVTLPSEAVTGNGDVEAADLGRLFRVTSTATLSLLAAATAGAGYFFRVWADGAAATIDPNASETIEGGATLVIADGDAALVYTDGTTWSALVSPTSGKLGTAATVDVIDEDDMASDSATRPPSQQSVKAYVDNNAGGGASSPVWANYNQSTPAVTSSENVSSITDTATGQYVVNFTNNMSNAEYAIGGSAQGTAAVDFAEFNPNAHASATIINPTSSSFSANSIYRSGSHFDAVRAYSQVDGVLA